MLDEKEEDRIMEIIDADDFPEDHLYFSEEFVYAGRQYSAIGYVIVEGKGYSFNYNDDEGIMEWSLEENNDAFDYIKLKS